MTNEDRQEKFERWHAYFAAKKFLIPVGVWFAAFVVVSMVLSVMDSPHAQNMVVLAATPPLVYGGVMFLLTLLVSVHGYYTYKP